MAISVDIAANMGDNGGTTSSLTFFLNISGSDGLLVVGFLGDVIGGADDVSSVTANGVAMTLVDKNITGFPSGTGAFARMHYLYYLLNPTTGNIVITCGSTHYILGVAESFNGVGAIDTHTKQWAPVVTDQTLTTSITTGLANAWVVIAENGYNSDNSSPTDDGPTTTEGPGSAVGVTFGQPSIFHNHVKPLVTPGAFNFTTNRVVGNALSIPMSHLLLSFGPVVTGQRFLLIPN